MKPPILQVREQQHVDERFLHSEVTDKIIRVFYDVYNELGFGFLESVYDQAMFRALQQEGLHVEREFPIPVWFRGEIIADFRADLIVNASVLVKLKTGEAVSPVHISQTLSYL